MNIRAMFGLLIAISASLATDAQAILIGGTNYDKLLSGSVDGKVGEWYAMRKGYSFGTFGDDARWTQVRITNTAFEADSLQAAEDAGRFSFEFMKETSAASGALTATDIRVLSATGDLLMSLRLASSGFINATPLLGAAGNFTLTGLFETVGGDWVTNGIVSGSIYASINYANGVISNSKDFHANGGTFTLYAPGGGNNGGNNGETEVPEPATALLLGVAAVGGALKKRNKQSA